MICPLFLPPEYIIFSKDVPVLLYYAYLPAIFILLPFGIFIFKKNTTSLLNKLLLVITILFALWAFFNLILWTNINSDTIIFYWSFLGIISSLIAVSSAYFISVFLRKGEDIKLTEKVIYLLTLIPVFIVTPTAINISGFDLNICGSSGYVGFSFVSYYYLLGLLSVLWIITMLIYFYIKSDKIFKRQIILMGSGMVSFLTLFFGAGYYVDYINTLGETNSYSIELVGMLGMAVFLFFMGILIVRFKTFNIKVLSAQALVWSLIALIGSQFFYMKDVPVSALIVTGATLAVSALVGLTIVRSVKKEVQQKEELAKLDVELEDLLKQRESLVHLVTHKVKGSFTRSKYMFAGILDGTFGETSPEIKKVAEQGLESDNMGIETVDLVLNVANMQKGTVKYDMKPLNLREIVEKSMNEKKVVAEAKGLVIQNNITEGSCNILADAFWIKEAINNLLENSIKYTKTGGITVNLEKHNNKVVLSVKDTGVGITDEDKKVLFTEGGRGKDSVKVNVDSTGYGLYSVRLIIEAHKGRVWAESEGQGKGSTFFIELNTAQ